VWNSNASSEDVTENLIGTKRHRNDKNETIETFCKRENASDGEIETSGMVGTEHVVAAKRSRKGQKFNRVLKLGEQVAKWLGAVCPSQTNFSRTYNKAAIKFECRNGHNFYLNID